MRNSFKLLIVLLTLTAMCAILAVYTIMDNRRFVIVRQDIVIPNLPKPFDGYTILQISDLHSQTFGAQEKDLADTINTLDYDLIAVSGDVQDHKSNKLQPFYDLLQAIDRKDPLLCTGGNADPEIVDFYTGVISEVGKDWQANGCRLLSQPYSIERDGARLWFSELYDDNRRDSWHTRNRIGEPVPAADDPEWQKYLLDHANYKAEIGSIFAGISANDTLIGITHYPITQRVLDDPAHDGMLPFDLVLSGHYHGGQIRLPLIGALYIPIPSEPRKGFFPDQRIVSGLYVGSGMQQYTSRGLGAGGPIPLLQFRLFNTPEINLLTLRRAAE